MLTFKGIGPKGNAVFVDDAGKIVTQDASVGQGLKVNQQYNLGVGQGMSPTGGQNVTVTPGMLTQPAQAPRSWEQDNLQWTPGNADIAKNIQMSGLSEDEFNRFQAQRQQLANEAYAGNISEDEFTTEFLNLTEQYGIPTQVQGTDKTYFLDPGLPGVDPYGTNIKGVFGTDKDLQGLYRRHAQTEGEGFFGQFDEANTLLPLVASLAAGAYAPGLLASLGASPAVAGAGAGALAGGASSALSGDFSLQDVVTGAVLGGVSGGFGGGVNNTELTDSMFGDVLGAANRVDSLNQRDRGNAGAMDIPNPDEVIGSQEQVDQLDEDLLGNLVRFEEWLARQDPNLTPWDWTPPPPPTEDAGGSGGAMEPEESEPSESSEPSSGGSGSSQGKLDTEGRDPLDPAPFILGTYTGDGQMTTRDGRLAEAPPGDWEIGEEIPEGSYGEEDTEEPGLDLEGILDQFGDQWITNGMDAEGNLVTDPSVSIRDGELVDLTDPAPTFNGMAPDGGQITSPTLGTGGPGAGDGTGDGTGNGSNSGVQQLAQAGMGLFGQGEEFEDFMASVQTEFPLLQRLGITPSQYLAMLFARLQNTA